MEIGINHLRRMAITWQKRMNFEEWGSFLFYLILFLLLFHFFLSCLIFGMRVSED
ncbi:hypothetical protein BDV38DRAFT_258744 [Aspergillus pseudotamarii]|uniref:Uncharacterized protein n=1 Tax=Aspergillus pseudotamarii TaxID=132259 RepID=A0A5N6SF70_ASPPS|nr:uncharacterized protein BDV38DRAFT_258744 [Aspergillus pseudotamarii]KAE8133245.1 hypothetical protein BDV38DRAFT_258744 [Aspergillus pseudotamarii]